MDFTVVLAKYQLALLNNKQQYQGNLMKRFLVLLCLLVLNFSISQADVVINIVEVGGDVVATASGIIDGDQQGGGGSPDSPGGFVSGNGFDVNENSELDVGTPRPTIRYAANGNNAIFNNAAVSTPADSNTGDHIGLISSKPGFSDWFTVDQAYSGSGDKLVDSASTWNGTTLAALGFIEGSYEFSANGLSTITLNIGAVDTTDPTLLTSTPADNATGVSTDPPTLSLVFGEPVSYASGLIRMYRTSDDVEVNNRSVSGSTGSGTPNISISFENALAIDTEYYVLIPAGAFEDAAGNPYAGISSTTELSFSTGAAVPTYTVGGTVTDLTGAGLELQNTGADTLPIAADGPFTFATALEVGFSYVVTVSTQPTGQTCVVSNGSGTISDANVTDVAVTCADNPTDYTINGTVSGLGPNSVTLQNNGADDRDVDANGVFVFDTALPDGSSYDVTVLTQPTGQTCDVTNGVGTINGSDVLGVDVDCLDDVVAPPTPTAPIPTLSEWALILLTMFIGLMVFANRRRLF
jgi:hypothetical protein